MAKQYPLEVVFRAFVLYLDYHNAEQIARLDGMPQSAETIRNWVKGGEGTSGYPWDQIRDLSAATRAHAEYERVISDKALRPWQEKVEDIAQDLMDARDYVMAALKGGTIENPKVKDLIDVMKAEALIHGQATERHETNKHTMQLLGMIVANRLRENVKDAALLERIMDLIKQDFKAALVAGDDVKALKRLMPTKGDFE